MKFGVVLVTYNRLDKLKIALECYEKQKYLPKNIIVVNNASTDGTKEFLDKLAYIYTGHVNENPYEYLEELIPYYGKSHKIMFDIVRKK